MAELNGVTKGFSILIQKFYTDEFIRLSEENAKLREKLDTILSLEGNTEVSEIIDCFICDKICHCVDDSYICSSCKKQYCNRHLICAECKETNCNHLVICADCNTINHFKTLCSFHEDAHLNNDFICPWCYGQWCSSDENNCTFIGSQNICINPQCDLYRQLA